MAANGSVSKTGDVASFDDLQDEIAAAYAGVATSTAAAAAASASASAAAASATAASDDADAAAASEASAASDAAAASASATTASNAATAASGSAATALASAVAAGAQIYADTTAGLAATSNGDMFVIIENGAAAVYENQTGSAALAGYLTRPAFSSTAALSASGVGQVGEVRFVTGPAGGWFEWSGTNLSSKVTWDTEMGIWVPPSINLSGSSGAWVRRLDGYIDPKMFGATGGADDTDAVVCADNVFRELSPTFRMLQTSNHVTFVGLGDLVVTHTYATRAEADAALSGLDEHNVVVVTADETLGGVQTRWRVKDGAFSRMSTRSYNKMVIDAEGRNGVQLILGAGSHANMHLLAGSFQQGGIYNLRFNGQNPTAQYGSTPQPQLNPDTIELVFVEGYGVDIRNVTVRGSGGDGMRIKGLIGNFEMSGGTQTFQACEGWGLVIDQMSSLNITKFWGEANGTGDCLMRYDVADDNATAQGYWKKASVEIHSVYSENKTNGTTVFRIEGGHFAPKIGNIVLQGPAANRTTIDLASSAGADDFWKGCQGGYFDLGGLSAAKIVCDANSRNNVFVRGGGMWSAVENAPWDFRDSGKDNIVVWSAPDATAFNPGSVPGDVSVNLGSSNFVSNSAESAQLANTLGGIVGPVQDYHSNFTTGPSYAKATGFNTNDGGTLVNHFHFLSAQLPATVKTWYLVVLGRFEAHQMVEIGLYDTVSTHYYNWDSAGWSALVDQDVFGPTRTIRADRRHLSYALPFENDGTARTLRVQVKLKGAGEADLYHCWVTDHPAPALVGIRSGQCLGTPGNAVATTGTLAPANVVPVGTQVFNVTDSEMQVSDGANWIGAALS